MNSINTNKGTTERDEDTPMAIAERESVGPTGMTDVERDILRLVKNSKSVYSKEEPSMIYYNKDDELLAFEAEDPEKSEQFRKWLRKETSRFGSETGNGIINMRLNNFIATNNKEKNMVKVIMILHKTNFSPLGVEMINRNTARIKFRNKAAANECLTFFEVHNKLVSVYIDNREVMHKGIISDWPKGIPELFDALDSRNNIIKMERIKKRVWNRDNNIANYVASDNIAITFKGKNITEYVSIYDKMCFLSVRPYIEAVKQCYNCYRYGHFKRSCRNKARCPICGKDAHGECKEVPKCINCKGDHKSNYKGCIDYRINKGMCGIMAYNNCSYFEADKIVEGKDTEIPSNYDRYLAPQTWPSLPPPSKPRSQNKETEMSPKDRSPRGSNTQYKRPKINEPDSEEERKINKVRILNSKYSNKTMNERIIRSNIRKENNRIHNKEGKDPKGLAFMTNFNDNAGNMSFLKEDYTVAPDSEGEQYIGKEYKEYNMNMERKTIKTNKIENAFGNCKYRSRIRQTYKDI